MQQTMHGVYESMSHGTHMNESWRTYEWVMAHIRMSHVTYQCVITHANKVHKHMQQTTHGAYESCRVCMSHVTHVNESWHTYEWLMTHIWMSHGAHTNESCHMWMRNNTFEWVYRQVQQTMHGVYESYQHTWMSHVTHECNIIELCQIWMSSVAYERVIAPWMSHVRFEWVLSHMNESLHLEWVTA